MLKFRTWALVALLGVILLGGVQWIGASLSEEAFTTPFWVLLIGRFVVGLGVIGILSMVVLKFISKTPE